MPELQCHQLLVSCMGQVGVSSDESDEDGPVRRYVRITPAWRSEQLSQLQDCIDSAKSASQKPRPGHRRTLGNRPRSRINANRRNNDAIAPPGLPRNCYDPTWVQSLRPVDLAELDIVDCDYDFENGRYPEERDVSMGNAEDDDDDADDRLSYTDE
jgi:hypothetical protein